MQVGDWIAFGIFVTGIAAWWRASVVAQRAAVDRAEIAQANREWERAIALIKLGAYDEAQRMVGLAGRRMRAMRTRNESDQLQGQKTSEG